MPSLKRPPRIAFSEPMIGSSLLVSQTTSLGSVAGPLGAGCAAGACFAVSAASDGHTRAKTVLARRIVIDRRFSFMARYLSFVAGILFGIEGFTHRFADQDDQNDRNCKHAQRP